MRRPEPPKRADSAVRSTRLHITMDGAYLRKSTASTATRIRICGVICSMTYDAANARINSAKALVGMAFTPVAVSHLAAIPLLPDNSPSHRCSPPAVPRKRLPRALSWADAGGEARVVCFRARLESIRPLLKARSIHIQRLRRRFDPVPPRQLRRSGPQFLRKPRTQRMRSAKLLKPSPQLLHILAIACRRLCHAARLPPSTHRISQAQTRSCMLTGNSL